MGLGGYDSWSPNVPQEHLIARGATVETQMEMFVL